MSIGSVDHLTLYAEVEQALIARITDGSLSPGSRFPSEDCLAGIRAQPDHDSSGGAKA